MIWRFEDSQRNAAGSFDHEDEDEHSIEVPENKVRRHVPRFSSTLVEKAGYCH